ncbi:flagellar associated protein [Pelagophyceae sp. CCMP2097]|nr:flagellar associated protein [Pelagophyceae sp. CCMP2097]
MDIEVEGDDASGMKAGDAEAEFSLSAFEALERDFNEVLQTLSADRSLDRFRAEYEKIHRALKRSHEHERKLIKKVRELNTEIVNNASKVHTALKLSQDDQATISTLRKEIEKAWKMVDAAQQKETRAKDTIAQLTDEISNLSKLVEKGAKLSGGQESMVKELVATRDELQRQSDEQVAMTKNLEVQLTEMNRQHEDLQVSVVASRAKVEAVEEQLLARQAEVQREQRRRERLDRELRETRTTLERRQGEQEDLAGEVETLQASIAQLEKQLNDARNTMDKYLRDYDTLYQRTQKLTEDLEEQITKNQQQHLENVSLDKEVKVRKDEITRLSIATGQLERKVEREHRSAVTYKRLLDESKTPLLTAQMEMTALRKELDSFKSLTEKHEKEQHVLEREAKIAKKETFNAEQRVHVAQTHVQEHERIAYSLESEMNVLKAEIVKQRKVLYQLGKERERYGVEASEQRHLYLQAMEEVKAGDMRCAELAKNSVDWEAKLKQQQHLYEKVRGERNLYSKNLIEAQDGISELKRKFKVQNHASVQLKMELTAKDKAVVGLDQEVKKQANVAGHGHELLAKMRKMLESNDDVIKKQDGEIRRHTSIIKRMSDEGETQKKEYDQIIMERDLLGTQLIRRNDELALLYEKLKIQISTLRKGEAQYAHRVADVFVLRLKVRDVQRELAISSGSSAQLDDLRRELIAAQRELLQEKTKVKALSEELENPMNVHRWRKLEGSDPATFEMVQKIQMLQKRLIAKTEEVVEKDLLVQEKEKLYGELKHILARQPGPEVAEQLGVYQASLRQKTRQMKGMASELNMYQAQARHRRLWTPRLLARPKSPQEPTQEGPETQGPTTMGPRQRPL